MTPSRFPHSLVLIFGMIIVAQLLTYVLPAGEYDRVPDPGNPDREMVVPGSFHEIENAVTVGPLAFLTSIPKGMEAGADIIFFVFIVGGVIGVIRATGAVDAMIGAAIHHLGGRPVILVAGMTTLFAIGSSTIGMAEEYMPFIPLLVTMCLAMKMDAVVAMGIVYIGAGVGYGAAALNPFTVVIAQRIAGLEPTSGQLFRWAFLVICLVVAVAYIMWYARRVQRDPSKSLIADLDYSTGFEMPADIRFTTRRILVLTAFVSAIALFVVGIKLWDWYLTELGAVFLGLGILSAVIGGLSPNRVAREFCQGAAEMTTTALLIGFARTIQVVLDEGHLVDTIVHGAAGVIGEGSATLSAQGMLFLQSICNFFVPSGSGQAYVTMPLMVPLADVTGVSRQTAVLAYQFGDGFTNMIVPTNALLMGMLGLARLPYQRWLKFIMPLMLVLYVMCMIAIAVAISIDYR